jgi:signal transduction histidine kinase
MSDVLSDPGMMGLASMPPTSRQRWLAIAVVAALLVAFGVTAPFAETPLSRLDAFIPSIEVAIFVTDLITAVLLFAQFSIAGSRALLVLASGYLFTSLIVIPHALTFPGAFSPTGLLGAGLQSTGWLYYFWHFGMALALFAYAGLNGVNRQNNMRSVSTASDICWAVAVVICLVCGLAWLATAGDEFLPRLFVDRSHVTPVEHYVGALNVLVGGLALALLWIRRRSVLDQWLLVATCALIIELLLIGWFNSGRFCLGFYAGRVFSLVTSTVILVVLLTETTRLYARLAHSNIALRRERDNKLMNVEAALASISHEVRQPLTAIATNGGAALRFLGHTPPNHEEARSALGRIISDSTRTNQVLDDMRALFKTIDQGQTPVDVNEVALGVLGTLREEFEEYGITTRAELTPELGNVIGHEGQLREVILNLIHNAVEAMATIKDGSRILCVTTQNHGRDAITVAVEDSGPGIDPKKLDGIFDAFVTTKSKGMGLGLAICRMIIERHGGQLSARSSKKRSGTVFQFTLPIKSAGSTAASSH